MFARLIYIWDLIDCSTLGNKGKNSLLGNTIHINLDKGIIGSFITVTASTNHRELLFCNSLSKFQSIYGGMIDRKGGI